MYPTELTFPQVEDKREQMFRVHTIKIEIVVCM